MKRFKKFTSILIATALLILLPAGNTLTVSAEEPTRHYVKYVEAKNEWRYQQTMTWDSNSEGRDLYYLKEGIKDGDILVIEGSNSSLNLELPVKLSNLTINHANLVVVTTNGIQELYVLQNSVAAINGDISNAYVYDNAVCNINNNATNLILYGNPKVEPTVVVAGTVDYVKISDATQTYYEFYNFATGSFHIDKGIMKTDVSKYSSTPSKPASQPAADNTVTTQTSDSSDEYDDVPKTGDSSTYLVFLIISALCFAGSYLLKSKKA